MAKAPLVAIDLDDGGIFAISKNTGKKTKWWKCFKTSTKIMGQDEQEWAVETKDCIITRQTGLMDFIKELKMQGMIATGISNHRQRDAKRLMKALNIPNKTKMLENAMDKSDRDIILVSDAPDNHYPKLPITKICGISGIGFTGLIEECGLGQTDFDDDEIQQAYDDYYQTKGKQLQPVTLMQFDPESGEYEEATSRQKFEWDIGRKKKWPKPPKKAYEMLILDADGTVWDAKTSGGSHIVGNCGMKPYTRIDKKNDVWSNGKCKIKVKKGLRETLEILKQNGIIISMASNNPFKPVSHAMEQIGIAQYFDYLGIEAISKPSNILQGLDHFRNQRQCIPDEFALFIDDRDNNLSDVKKRFEGQLPVMDATTIEDYHDILKYFEGVKADA